MPGRTRGRDGKSYPSQHRPDQAARNAAIVEAWRNGWSMADLADECGLSVGSIHRIVRAADAA